MRKWRRRACPPPDAPTRSREAPAPYRRVFANRQHAFALNDVSAQTPQVLCGDLRYGATIVVEDRRVKSPVASVRADNVARSCINCNASCEDAATCRQVVFQTEKVLIPLAP